MQIEWKKVDSGRKNGIAFNLYEGAFRTPCPGVRLRHIRHIV
jgi:hypothetical protein